MPACFQFCFLLLSFSPFFLESFWIDHMSVLAYFLWCFERAIPCNYWINSLRKVSKICVCLYFSTFTHSSILWNYKGNRCLVKISNTEIYFEDVDSSVIWCILQIFFYLFFFNWRHSFNLKIWLKISIKMHTPVHHLS